MSAEIQRSILPIPEVKLEHCYPTGTPPLWGGAKPRNAWQLACSALVWSE